MQNVLDQIKNIRLQVPESVSGLTILEKMSYFIKVFNSDIIERSVWLKLLNYNIETMLVKVQYEIAQATVLQEYDLFIDKEGIYVTKYNEFVNLFTIVKEDTTEYDFFTDLHSSLLSISLNHKIEYKHYIPKGDSFEEVDNTAYYRKRKRLKHLVMKDINWEKSELYIE